MGGRDEECVELYKEGESLSLPKKLKDYCKNLKTDNFYSNHAYGN
jgi:hypothetical protein